MHKMKTKLFGGEKHLQLFGGKKKPYIFMLDNQ